MSEAVEIIHDSRSVMLLPSTDPRRVAFEAAVAEQLSADREAHAARTAARKAEAPRLPEDCRAALAQAITARDKIEQALAKARTAQSQASANTDTVSKWLEAARSAAEKARAEHIQHAEEAARAGKPMSTSNRLRAANSEVTDASEAVEAARAAGTKIAERLSGLERELRRAQDQ